MANGSDAEMLVRLLGGTPEALLAKRLSEIEAQNPGALSPNTPGMAGLNARMMQSEAENTQNQRRQGETRSRNAEMQGQLGETRSSNPIVDSVMNALMALGSIPANAAQVNTAPELMGLLRDVNPFNVERLMGSGEFEQLDPQVSGQDVTGNPLTGALFDLFIPGPDAAMLPIGRAARGNNAAEQIIEARLANPSLVTPGDVQNFIDDLKGVFPRSYLDKDGGTLRFGPHTMMGVSFDNYRLRPILTIDTLETSRPHSVGSGLHLMDDERQILTLLDFADIHGIPVVTMPSAFSHRAMTTTQLRHMYNRLGFEKNPDFPERTLVREPMPLDWPSRKREFKRREVPEWGEQAEVDGNFKVRIARGDALTISELEQYHKARATYAPMREFKRHAEMALGDNLPPEQIDLISRVVGHYVLAAENQQMLASKAIDSMAEGLRISSQDARNLFWEYRSILPNF